MRNFLSKVLPDVVFEALFGVQRAEVCTVLVIKRYYICCNMNVTQC
jgi:hypothetical protein